MFRNIKKLRYAIALTTLTAIFVTGLVFGETTVFQPQVLAENAEVSKETAVENIGQMPVYFEENKGQFNSKVRYFTRGTKGYDLFLTATDAVYVLSSPKSQVPSSKFDDLQPKNNGQQTTDNGQATAVYMTLAGANENSTFAGSQTLEHKTNYFKGAESDWRTEIANYGQVRTNQVYEGIDMVWHGKENGGVQYDFVVEPNANPNQIEWQIKGANAVELTAEGDLLIKTEFGEIKQNKPFTYQDANGFRQEIESRFVLSEPSAVADGLNAESFKIKFELGNYDRSKTLTIDPTVNLSQLSYSTFLGGSLNDEGNGITTARTGNVYVTGVTSSPEFPTTAGDFDTSHNGEEDVFVIKLNATGSALVYSTFIGGSDTDYGRRIIVDSSGNAFVTGYTTDGTTDYPTTLEVFQPQNNGGNDAFVSKLGDYSISGGTLDTSGLPLVNTAVAMSGDNTDFILSDAEGRFYFGDTIFSGTNLVSATQVLYNFNPPNFQVNVNRNKQITFVGRPTTSGPTVAFGNLGGGVTSTAGNIGLPNTTLTLIDTFGTPRTTVTDAQGNYRFSNVQLGSFYIVVAERDGYNLSPPTAVINFLEPTLNINFSARPNNPRPVQDFDGDGKSDLAVFRPSEGNWYILQSQTNSMKVVNFSISTDIPVPADYNGDGRFEQAVYRAGTWYQNYANGSTKTFQFGLASDKPVVSGLIL